MVPGSLMTGLEAEGSMGAVLGMDGNGLVFRVIDRTARHPTRRDASSSFQTTLPSGESITIRRDQA
jgi:hypothetical protein